MCLLLVHLFALSALFLLEIQCVVSCLSCCQLPFFCAERLTVRAGRLHAQKHAKQAWNHARAREEVRFIVSPLTNLNFGLSCVQMSKNTAISFFSLP